MVNNNRVMNLFTKLSKKIKNFLVDLCELKEGNIICRYPGTPTVPGIKTFKLSEHS